MLKSHLAEYICKDYNIWITLVNKKKTTPRYLFVINWAKERTRPSRIHPWILFNVKPVYYHSLMTKQCYSWPHLCKQFSIERNTNNSCHDKLKILNIQSLAWLNDKTFTYMCIQKPNCSQIFDRYSMAISKQKTGKHFKKVLVYTIQKCL